MTTYIVPARDYGHFGCTRCGNIVISPLAYAGPWCTHQFRGCVHAAPDMADTDQSEWSLMVPVEVRIS